jgi:hypothetical protein
LPAKVLILVCARATDRATILEHPAQTERHALRGELTLLKQRALIAKLEKNGHDTRQAHDLLRKFEASQVLYVADRDRLRDELSSIKE